MKYTFTRRIALCLSVLRYVVKMRKWPRMKHPRDVNEKIMYLEFYTDQTVPARLSDKYAVREYVRERGLEHILVPLYGHYASASEIDFGALPDSFVVKLNNGYGDIQIVRDKYATDLEALREKLAQQLKKKFGVLTGEPHYTLIPPCIIIEKLLPLSQGVSSSLIDYKIWCFDGKADFCLVCFDRDFSGHKAQLIYYEIRPWRRRGDKMHHTFANDREIPEPRNLHKMIEYAETLAKGLPCVRVDLYEVDGRVYFGEMTFSSNSGRMRYFTDSTLMEMGAKITLPAPAQTPG